VRLSANDVSKYLCNNPNVVKELLLTSFSTDFLEKVIEQKKILTAEGDSSGLGVNFARNDLVSPSTSERPGSQLSRNVKTLHTDTGIESMCRTISGMTKDEDIYSRIYEICSLIASTLSADDFLFFVCDTAGNLVAYSSVNGTADLGKVVSDDTVPAVSARTRKPLIVEYVHLDDKFKDGVGDGSYKECHALCVPIFLESGHAYCVVEFVRLNLAKHFDQFSYNLTTGILSWIMACLQKMKKNRVRIRIRNTLL